MLQGVSLPDGPIFLSHSLCPIPGLSVVDLLLSERRVLAVSVGAGYNMKAICLNFTLSGIVWVLVISVICSCDELKDI